MATRTVCTVSTRSPISPCLVMGLEWILRMSRRACSLGSSMSGTERREFSVINFRLSKKNDHSLFLVGRGPPYGFYGRACQAAAGPGPGCRVCWWPWSSWLCGGCRSRPSGSAAESRKRPSVTPALTLSLLSFNRRCRTAMSHYSHPITSIKVLWISLSADVPSEKRRPPIINK